MLLTAPSRSCASLDSSLVPTDHTKVLRQSPRSDAAWRSWFAFVYPSVYYAMYRATSGDTHLSEDLTQGAIERFLRYRALHKVDTDQDSVAYLIRIAHRLHLDFRHDHAATSHVSLDSDPPRYEPAEPNRTDDTLPLDLALLMQRLPPPDRELIQWLFAGMSMSEIAESLGVSYTAAATRVHRARARLKRVAHDL